MNDTALRYLRNRIKTRYRTLLSHLAFKRALRIQSPVPLISFTFDDFPRSALLDGGAILNKYGINATFYGSLSLMGQETVVGELFRPQDIPTLLSQGNELGCHTYGHLDPWRTTPAQFEDSIIKNARAVKEIIPGFTFHSFSYPLFYPQPQVKSRAGQHFSCCRGGGQKANIKVLDLNLLKAFFLERCRGDFNQVRYLIDQNCRARGWLIFVTHDISRKPSQFGCESTFFEDIVRYAIQSGSMILPVIQAYQSLSADSARRT